jgi:hypothetical protein
MILALRAFTGVPIDPATMPKSVQGAKPAVQFGNLNGPAGATGPERPAPLGSSPARCSTSTVSIDVPVATTVKGDPKMPPLPVPQSAPVLQVPSPAVVVPAPAAAAPQASRSALTDAAIVHLGLYVLKAQVNLKSTTAPDADCRNYFGEVCISSLSLRAVTHLTVTQAAALLTLNRHEYEPLRPCCAACLLRCQMQAIGYGRRRAATSTGTGRPLLNPEHTIDKATFKDACPRLQALGFVAGHGVNLQGLHFVQPLSLASYQAALPRLLALFTAHSVLVAGSGGHGGVAIPSAEEYALKKGFLSSGTGRVQEDTVDLVATDDGEAMPVPGLGRHWQPQAEIRMDSDGQRGTCRHVLRCFALRFEVACEPGCLNCTLCFALCLQGRPGPNP